MKIQKQNSVLNTGVWEISEMSQVQQTQNALQVSQTESTAKLPTEAQRNQRLSEFKSQEQLMRANLQRQLPSSLNAQEILDGKKLDKQRGGDSWYGEGNEGDLDPDTPGKQPFDIEEAVRWMAARDEMENALDDQTARTTEEARTQIRTRDAMDALIRTLNEAEHSKAWHLRRDPTRGRGTPAGTPTIIKTDKLGSDGSAIGAQAGVVATPGSQQGGPTIGPQPGQGGTLTGQGGDGGGGALTPGNRGSQKGDGGKGPGVSGWGDGGGVKGRNDGGSDDAPENTVETRTSSHWGGQTVGPYTHESPSKYRLYGGKEDNDSESQTSGEPKKELPKKEPTEEQADPYSTGIPVDPESGGRAGNDVGGGKLEKYKVKGVTQQEKDLVGPAFGKTTGPDDKERPNTGNTQGTVWNPTEGDDLGDDLSYDLNGGGSVDIEVGKVLLEQIRPINPGGPDPTKREGE